MQTVYQLASTTAASANALASFDVQNQGSIVRVEWALQCSNTAGSAAGALLQVSFGSTITTGNDSRQAIANACIGTPLAASTGVTAQNGYVDCEIPVGQGERIYLHSSTFITVPDSVRWLFLVYVEDKSA